MSETQIPDRWVILNIKTKDENYRVVLAGWYGGYLGSDSWRRSSPIASIVSDEDKHVVTTESGTKYTLYKSQEGLSMLMGSIYSQMTSQAEASGTEVCIEEGVK